jgi:hypothetical protein
MAAKLTRLTHKIAIKLQLVAESCTTCSSRSRRPVRKVLDTTSCARVYNETTWSYCDLTAPHHWSFCWFNPLLNGMLHLPVVHQPTATWFTANRNESRTAQFHTANMLELFMSQGLNLLIALNVPDSTQSALSTANSGMPHTRMTYGQDTKRQLCTQQWIQGVIVPGMVIWLYKFSYWQHAKFCNYKT